MQEVNFNTVPAQRKTHKTPAGAQLKRPALVSTPNSHALSRKDLVSVASRKNSSCLCELNQVRIASWVRAGRHTPSTWKCKGRASHGLLHTNWENVGRWLH